MKMNLSGRRALVCGSTQGIGRACAAELAVLGASVVLFARNERALQEVRASLPQVGDASHEILAADFSFVDKTSAALEAFLQTGRRIHILINNTGGPPHGAMLDATPEQFLAAFSQHLLCNQMLTKAVVPGMKADGYGRIINIISTSVLIPIRGIGVSNTTRGAVANWGRSLAAELGPLGITVNNVLPGFTDTARLRELLQHKSVISGTPLTELIDQSCKAIPAGRFASPEEIASVVGFLATPSASYINGVNLPVDGGRTAAQ